MKIKTLVSFTILSLIIAGLVLVAVFKYRGSSLEEGTIIRKIHEPESRTTTILPILVGKVTMMIPYEVYDDEDWILVIEGFKGERIVKKNIYVTQAVWRLYAVNDYYDITKSDVFEDKHVKTKVEG